MTCIPNYVGYKLICYYPENYNVDLLNDCFWFNHVIFFWTTIIQYFIRYYWILDVVFLDVTLYVSSIPFLDLNDLCTFSHFYCDILYLIYFALSFINFPTFWKLFHLEPMLLKFKWFCKDFFLVYFYLIMD